MTNLAATGGVPGPGRIGRVAIGDLLKRAATRFPDRVALTDGPRRVTFTELERDANRFANYLVARGFKPGDKISTINNNSVEFVKALFGIHRAGLVWVPINTMLGPSDMDYILDHAEVRFALIDDNLHAQPERRAAQSTLDPRDASGLCCSYIRLADLIYERNVPLHGHTGHRHHGRAGHRPVHGDDAERDAGADRN